MKLKMMLSVLGVAVVLLSTSTEAMAQEEDLEQRIFNLGILRTGKSSSKSSKKRDDPKLLLAQVQQDFTSLQVANNALAEANEKSQRLDPEFVTKTTTEIHTRAERLMENLTETRTKKKEIPPQPSDQSQLKILISKLDIVVGEFAHNPVFKEASSEDEKLAKKALQDLDQIIELSSQIIEGTRKLKPPSPE